MRPVKLNRFPIPEVDDELQNELIYLKNDSDYHDLVETFSVSEFWT